MDAIKKVFDMKTGIIFGLIALCMTINSSSIFAKSPNNASPNEKSAFLDSDWEAAQIKAVREGKMIVVDFSAKWCLPCRWMEEETFVDDDLIKVMSNEFISLKFDIQSFDGVALKQQYAVRRLPTILILNPHGEEIKRFTESMSAHALKYEFDQLIENHHYTGKPYYKLKREGLSRTEGKEDELNNSAENTERKGVIKISKYVLQFGVFSTVESAEKMAQTIELKSKVVEKNVNGKALFAVVTDQYYSEEEAKLLGEELLASDNLPSLVKKLN